VTALVLTTLAGVGGRARGQAAGAAAPRKIYTNRTAFKLPLRVEERDRPRLQEVQLYVREGVAGAWVMKDSVPPSQSEFIYRVTQEGEYWFAVVTVDKNGRRNPADLTQEQPGLVVVVDKQPPEVDVHPGSAPNGTPLLQCEIKDANPDPTKTRLEYLTADQTWQSLDALPDQPASFRVADPGALRGLVRVTAVDLAGNKTTREVHLTAMSAPAEPRWPAAEARLPAADSRPPVNMEPRPPLPDRLPNLADSRPTAAGDRYGPGIEPAAASAPTRSASYTESRSEKVSSTAPRTMSNAVRQLVNSTHVSLKYHVEQEGPSGVSRVEVWMTRDDGQNWQMLCEDPNRRSPVEIDLPGDGQYGLSLVVSSGAGSGTAPTRGEAPDWRIEVDTVKPMAQLLAIRPSPGGEPGMYLITWTASDKNLKPEPIDLEYASRPEGPWQPIARSLRNDGNYRWLAPHDMAGELHVRMHVTDQAGNTTTCSSQPVSLDRVRPKAHVIGVVAGSAHES
jgi:hypothetical protein